MSDCFGEEEGGSLKQFYFVPKFGGLTSTDFLLTRAESLAFSFTFLGCGAPFSSDCLLV